jgi:hypothetical protein
VRFTAATGSINELAKAAHANREVRSDPRDDR